MQSFLGNPSVSAQTLLALKSECGHGPGVAKLTQMMTSAGVWSGPPQFPGATWNAYWNKYPAFDDENNLSLAFQLVVNGFGFLFPGDLESAGWKQLLGANPLGFTNAVKATNFLIASHHGRISGVCTELFDDYGCSPQLVVISDDCHQYDTQKTTTYYASKCSGIQNFRIAGTTRFVLTTRSDGPINFSFPSAGGCVVT